MPQTNEQVQDIVRYYQTVNDRFPSIPLSVKSGGHGLTAVSTNDNGLLIDFAAMNRIKIIDEAKGLVSIQAGAVWGEVAKALTPHGLVISSGDHGDTGVGGLAISGGFGILLRSYGLTIDKVIGVHLVTGDGELRWVDAEHDPDLFWGIRGGGGQLGIVTDFLFQADVVDTPDSPLTVPIVVQTIDYPLTDLSDFLSEWHHWSTTAPPELTSILAITKNPSGTLTASARNFWYGEKTSQAAELFHQGETLAPSTNETLLEMNYSDFFSAERKPLEGKNTAYGKNVLLKDMTDDLANELATLLVPDFVYGIELCAIGGKMNDYEPTFNAWSYRDAAFLVSFWFDHTYKEEGLTMFHPLQQLGFGVYGAYSSDSSKKETARCWSKETADRLRSLAETYDPSFLFTQNRTLR